MGQKICWYDLKNNFQLFFYTYFVHFSTRNWLKNQHSKTWELLNINARLRIQCDFVKVLVPVCSALVGRPPSLMGESCSSWLTRRHFVSKAPPIIIRVANFKSPKKIVSAHHQSYRYQALKAVSLCLLLMLWQIVIQCNPV